MKPMPDAVQDAVRRVALVGRQNSGKTSLLMHLTGSAQRPVNFPGTSVERVESRFVHEGRELIVIDLPGITSLAAGSHDEAVTLDYLSGHGERPDLLCVVLDATKLIVELHFLAQVRRLGLPVVVALTKLDVAERAGRPVAVERLRSALGVPVLAVNGFTGEGSRALQAALAAPPTSALAAIEPGPLAGAVQSPGRGRLLLTDRLDAVLLNRWLGPVALVLLLFGMFHLVFTVAEPFIGWIEQGQQWVGDGVRAVLDDSALRSFVIDGLINGLGSSLVFVPQIALLIALITVLEGSGYMARAVFQLDRLMRRVGLSGKSFVPLTTSFACAIPGILAARILSDDRDRLTTIAVAPLMSCSARLPVYVLLIGAFFAPGSAALVLIGMYLVGVVTAVLVALVVRKGVLRGGESLLTMELPPYQRPSLRVVWAQVRRAVTGFLRTAGSIILVAAVVVWTLSYFPRPTALLERFAAERSAAVAAAASEADLAALDARHGAELLEQSWLAGIGRTVQPVFAPCGFDWKATVGILAAFPARELVIPTLGTLHSLGEVEADPDAPDPGLREALRTAVDAHGRPTMNWLVALALMAFFALCSQCVATLASIRSETRSWRWPLFTFGYMTALAWLVATAIYQVGSWFGHGLPA